MFHSVSFQTHTGSAIRPHMHAIAALRMEIFKEYPYLCDGSTEYEQAYLKRYIESEKSLAVFVMDGTEIVGGSTGICLADEMDAIREPMIVAGYHPDRLFYCGESVLKKSHRGAGIYPVLFREREAHVSALGLQTCCFCAVERPDIHPKKPQNYKPLDDSWKRYGYRKHLHLKARLSWREIGQDVETEKTLRYWIKSLG